MTDDRIMTFVTTEEWEGTPFGIFVSVANANEAGQMLVEFAASEQVELDPKCTVRAVIVPHTAPAGAVTWPPLPRSIAWSRSSRLPAIGRMTMTDDMNAVDLEHESIALIELVLIEAAGREKRLVDEALQSRRSPNKGTGTRMQSRRFGRELTPMARNNRYGWKEDLYAIREREAAAARKQERKMRKKT
jgi:hypothetical protein